jgi:hypothetical protein
MLSEESVSKLKNTYSYLPLNPLKGTCDHPFRGRGILENDDESSIFQFK